MQLVPVPEIAAVELAAGTGAALDATDRLAEGKAAGKKRRKRKEARELIN